MSGNANDALMVFQEVLQIFPKLLHINNWKLAFYYIKKRVLRLHEFPSPQLTGEAAELENPLTKLKNIVFAR